MSLARQGEKQREVYEWTALANAEQIQLCPPIRLPTSAPLPKERERARERRRERSQQHEKGKENKAATFAATFHRSSVVVVGLAVSPPRLSGMKRKTPSPGSGPKAGSGTWSKTKRNKQISTYPSGAFRHEVHVLTQSQRSDTRPEIEQSLPKEVFCQHLASVLGITSLSIPLFRKHL